MKNLTAISLCFFVSFAASAMDELPELSPDVIAEQLEQFKKKFNAVVLKLGNLNLLVGPGKIALVDNQGRITEPSAQEQKRLFKELENFILDIDKAVTEAENKFQELKETFKIYKEYKKEKREEEEAAQDRIAKESTFEARALAPEQNTIRAIFHHYHGTIFYCQYLEGILYYDSESGYQWFEPHQIANPLR